MPKTYIISGLGVDKRVFQNINFEGLDIEHIDWIVPQQQETISALIPNAGLPVTSIGKNVLVCYYYLGAAGQKITGQSKTSDFSILTLKKAEDKIKLFVSEYDETISCMIPEEKALKNNWEI